MKRALVASAAIHALLGVALLSHELVVGDAASPSTAVAIDVIDVIAPTPREAPPETVHGGGASASIAALPSPSPARHAGRRKARARPASDHGELAINHQVTIDCPSFGQAAEMGTVPIPVRGCARGGVDRDGDGGEGTGIGGHRGAGIGLGDGDRIVLAETLEMPDPPNGDVPPPSKARPAKLIYPKKQRDLGEEKLFVARVTVDTDGYVVGARLLKGISGPRDSEATDLIFRFRYAPALDQDGRAVVSTFEQPFHVNR